MMNSCKIASWIDQRFKDNHNSAKDRHIYSK